MLKIKVRGNNKLASLLLRIGLAAVLLYASISSFKTPADWIGYLPHILTTHVSGLLLLHIFSGYEILLALWLLFGFYLKYAAILAAISFSGILLSNLGLLSVTFRDIAMVFTSLALIFIE
ncbi:MAG TPA: DoxX family membrane protein [Candidatus Saccharimonadales bacterium]